MSIQTRTIDYDHLGLRHQGFFAHDDSRPQPQPGILVAHAWAGRDDFACDKARRLAEAGYAAFALDMYGNARVGSGPDENAQLMNPLIQNRSLLRDRMHAALNCIRSQPEVDTQRIAAMGFCFGGLCVLDLARSGANVGGVISFHGLLTPPASLKTNPIHSKVLVLHGFDDPMVPPEQVTALGRELTQAGADWQIHTYGKTMHAFTNPQANDPSFGTVYNPAADHRSWRSLMDFLAEVLK